MFIIVCSTDYELWKYNAFFLKFSIAKVTCRHTTRNTHTHRANDVILMQSSRVCIRARLFVYAYFVFVYALDMIFNKYTQKKREKVDLNDISGEFLWLNWTTKCITYNVFTLYTCTLLPAHITLQRYNKIQIAYVVWSGGWISLLQFKTSKTTTGLICIFKTTVTMKEKHIDEIAYN